MIVIPLKIVLVDNLNLDYFEDVFVFRPERFLYTNIG